MPHGLVIPFIPPGNGSRGVKEGLGGTGQERRGGWVAEVEGVDILLTVLPCKDRSSSSLASSKTNLRLATALTGGRKRGIQ